MSCGMHGWWVSKEPQQQLCYHFLIADLQLCCAFSEHSWWCLRVGSFWVEGNRQHQTVHYRWLGFFSKISERNPKRVLKAWPVMTRKAGSNRPCISCFLWEYHALIDQTGPRPGKRNSYLFPACPSPFPLICQGPLFLPSVTVIRNVEGPFELFSPLTHLPGAPNSLLLSYSEYQVSNPLKVNLI